MDERQEATVFWTERVLPILVTLSTYAVYFRFAGLWEQKVEWWIGPENARDVTLWVGRIVLGLIHFAAMLMLAGFFVVHMLMILAAGPLNELRSIVTGWYRTDLPQRSGPKGGA